MSDDDPLTKFFVRFKQNVDAHVAAAIRSTLGIPSIVSESMRTDGRWPDTKEATSLSTGTSDVADPQSHRSSPASSGRNPQHGQSLWDLLPVDSLAGVEAFSESIYQLSWMSFLVDSPYSPLHLRHLPQPVPRDLPDGAEPSAFGFEDAFEDLLCVTSGQGLMDINDRYSIKKEWQHSYPQGLPPILWVHQLSRQGLWDGWEPRPEVLERVISERWRRWLRHQDDPFRPSKDVTRHGDKPAGHESGERPRSDAQKADLPSPKTSEADFEEELYDLLEQGKALAAPIRATIESISKLNEAVLQQDPTGRTPGGDTPSGSLPKGYREDVKIEERTDSDGCTTVTKTRVLFDENDVPVSRLTDTRITQSHSRGSSGDELKSRSAAHTEPDGGKQTWFWK